MNNARKLFSPPVVLTFFFGLLCIFALTYVPTLLQRELTPGLEVAALLMFCVALSSGKITKTPMLIALISAGYILYGYIFSVLIGGDHVLDFLLIYKAYYYIILMSIFVDKTYFSKRYIHSFLNLTLSIFLIKYSIDKFAFGIARPSVLVENNFELVFLSLIFYLNSIAHKGISVLHVAAMMAIFVLSGSRSSVVCLVVVLFFSLAEGRLSGKKLLGGFVGFLTSMLVVGFIFYTRQKGQLDIADIDRFKFYDEFVFSTQNWSVLDWLFGSSPITPLDTESCRRLYFWKKMFSYDGTGSCYSVVLHSFLFRVLYDHGIVGLVFLHSAILVFLYKYSIRVRLAVLIVLLSTSLSVSALNNVYVALALFIFLSFDDRGEKGYAYDGHMRPSFNA